MLTVLTQKPPSFAQWGERTRRLLGLRTGNRLSFATLDYAGKKKTTKRRVFLAEMAAAMLWSVLQAVTAPHYLKWSDGNELLDASRVQSVDIMRNIRRNQFSGS
jgi:hypothetical protein